MSDSNISIAYTDNTTIQSASEVDDSQPSGNRITIPARSRQSTPRTCDIHEFSEVTDKAAGTGVSGSLVDNGIGPRPQLLDNRYTPFENVRDFGLAMWFHERQLTKGDVTSFLQDNRGLPWIHESLSFRSAEDWQAKMDAIPHGIPYSKLTVMCSDNRVRNKECTTESL